MVDRDTLSSNIKRSFDDSKPQWNSQVVEDVPGDLERQEIGKAFQKRRWSAIGIETLRYHAEALFFFTPQAYRYFLPAYLLAVLEDYEASDIISNVLITTLTPPSEDDERFVYFLARFDLLTNSQKRVITGFLEFMLQEHGEDFWHGELKSALENYWKDFGYNPTLPDRP